jgi:hypothetical protein
MAQGALRKIVKTFDRTLRFRGIADREFILLVGRKRSVSGPAQAAARVA